MFCTKKMPFLHFPRFLTVRQNFFCGNVSFHRREGCFPAPNLQENYFFKAFLEVAVFYSVVKRPSFCLEPDGVCGKISTKCYDGHSQVFIPCISFHPCFFASIFSYLFLRGCAKDFDDSNSSRKIHPTFNLRENEWKKASTVCTLRRLSANAATSSIYFPAFPLIKVFSFLTATPAKRLIFYHLFSGRQPSIQFQKLWILFMNLIYELNAFISL